MITLFLFVIAAPIYLLIAGLVIGVTYLVNILPTLLAIYLLMAFLAGMLTPLKPWFNKSVWSINRSASRCYSCLALCHDLRDK